MTIQKKSLISKLNTTKKAAVAPTQENPSVSTPVSARLAVRFSMQSRVRAMKAAKR